MSQISNNSQGSVIPVPVPDQSQSLVCSQSQSALVLTELTTRGTLPTQSQQLQLLQTVTSQQQRQQDTLSVVVPSLEGEQTQAEISQPSEPDEADRRVPELPSDPAATTTAASEGEDTETQERGHESFFETPWDQQSPVAEDEAEELVYADQPVPPATPYESPQRPRAPCVVPKAPRKKKPTLKRCRRGSDMKVAPLKFDPDSDSRSSFFLLSLCSALFSFGSRKACLVCHGSHRPLLFFFFFHSDREVPSDPAQQEKVAKRRLI